MFVRLCRTNTGPMTRYASGTNWQISAGLQPAFGDDRVVQDADEAAGQGADERGSGQVANGRAEHGIHAAEQALLRVDQEKEPPAKAGEEASGGRHRGNGRARKSL